MNKFNLIHSVIFSNADREEDKDFDQDFYKMWPETSKYIEAAACGLTGVPVLVEFDPVREVFQTSNKARQEFLLVIEILEETNFEVKVAVTLTDAVNTVHSLIRKNEYTRSRPVWMLPFSIKSEGVQIVEKEVVKEVEVIRNVEVIKEVPVEKIVEVIKYVDVPVEPSVPVLPSSKILEDASNPAQYSIPGMFSQEGLSATVEVNTSLNERIDEICTLLDKIDPDSMKIASLLNIPAGIIIQIRFGTYDVNAEGAEAQLDMILKKTVDFLKKRPAQSVATTATEVDSGVTHLEEVKKEEKAEELKSSSKEALANTFLGYFSLLGNPSHLTIVSQTSIPREVMMNISVERYDNIPVERFLEAISEIKKLWERVRGENEMRGADYEERIKYVMALREIVSMARWHNMSAGSISAALGIDKNLYYAARGLHITRASTARWKDTLETAKLSMKRIAEREAKELQNDIDKEIEAKEAAELNVLANAPSLEKEELRKLNAEIIDIVKRMKLNFAEFSDIAGITPTVAPNLMDMRHEGMDAVELTVIRDTLIEAEKADLENTKSVKSMKDLAKIVPKSIDGETGKESTVELPQYGTKYLKLADEKLRKRYGASYESQGGRISREIFNDNRRRLNEISSNSIELSRKTNIPLSVVNKSFNLGSKLPAKILIALDLYLRDVEIAKLLPN